MSRPTLKFALPVLLAFVALALAALGAWAGPPGSTAGLPALQGATDQAPATAQTPAAPAKPAAAVAAGPNDAWNRIRAAGRIVAGTSADYPPFEYRMPDFSIGGFDADVMREIGRRMGVDVELRDFAFDGLLSGVELDQLDVAIAAVSLTDERLKQVDFSRVYYVADDAVLAAPVYSGVTVRLPDNMKDSTVGVQKGSVYETWAQRALIDTGLIKPDNLVPYADVRQGVADLKGKKVDYFLLDAGPAQDFVKQGDAKLVGQGLNRQSYAIALPKDSPALAQQINSALDQMFADGTITQLIQKDINHVEEKATATAVPATVAPTPTPVPTCLYSMAWVADLTYDDFNMTAPPVFAPGQGFTKSWRLRNSGTCPWEPGYTLNFVAGNVPAARMSAQPYIFAKAVPVGGTADVSVNMVAPRDPGTYSATWQMRDDKGVSFGERIWVGIRVPGAPTPPPPPPPGPGPVPPTPAPPPPPVKPADVQISQFGTSKNTIQKGQCVTLNWQITGPVISQILRRNGQVLTTDLNARSFRDCPGNTGRMNYRLEATNGVTPRYNDRNVEVIEQMPL
jgi:polar amino acid transport system substrate-binding protein